MHSNSDEEPNRGPEVSSIKSPYKRKIKIVSLILVPTLLLMVAFASYIYAVSPSVVREPKLEHYHFRMQILIDGKAEDFGSDTYQTGYNKDLCNANLPEQPIHFHDKKDQFTHVHWEGMTGGMVMKYYGWNYIGGINDALGYKLDNLQDIQKVTTHGNYLPKIAKDSKIYIYSGDEKGYKERSFEDWKNQDLEKFFGVKSNSPAHDINYGLEQASILDKLFPKAYAHGTANDADGDDGGETDEQQLTRINNLLGNVVIFAQKDKPSSEQVKARFDKLVPLTESTCGG